MSSVGKRCFFLSAVIIKKPQKFNKFIMSVISGGSGVAEKAIRAAVK